LDEKEVDRIYAALDQIRHQPFAKGTKKLTGRKYVEYRIRVGEFRVLFDIDRVAREINIHGVIRRDKAYR
jgi:mRNA-degrading endonuclease RelE of RelBE toxin-antitoxin system